MLFKTLGRVTRNGDQSFFEELREFLKESREFFVELWEFYRKNFQKKLENIEKGSICFQRSIYTI
jgi:hypothetical protein